MVVGMKRRHFIISALAMPLFARQAMAYPSVAYAPATYRDVRARTDRLVINFRATWSLTCQMKADLIAQLIEQNPAYQSLTFMDVDWDTFGPSEWAERRLKVKRRSTLIAFKGPDEVARIVNEPFERSMRRFLDAAVSA